MTVSSSPQSGISLAETMIALFVIALLATAGGMMMTQSLRGARLVEDRASDSRELLTALSVLRDDFSAFVDRPSQNDATAGLPTRFEGQPVRSNTAIFSFVRNGWPNPAGQTRGDLQRIEYLFKDGALFRRSWSAPDPGPGTGVTDQMLLSGIESMTIRYGKEENWRSDWVVLSDAQSLLFPDKVELTLSFSEDDTLTAKFRLGLRK